MDDFKFTENDLLNEANLFKKIKDTLAKVGKGITKTLRGVSKYNIKAGAFVLFRYSSKGYKEKSLSFYDESPLSLILGRDKKNNNILGLNFHYLPLSDRKRVLKKLKSLYPKQFKENKNLLPGLNYKNISSELKDFDVTWLVKSYIPGNISKPISILSMNQVEKIVGEISLDTFVGINSTKLHGYFKKGYSMNKALKLASK